MFSKKTIKDINVKGKVILLRTDYNVPLENGHVTSDLRIRASLPTIQYLLDHEASKIVIISHLGRPEGRDKSLSLAPVAEVLAGLLPGRSVDFVDDVAGPEVEEAVRALPEGGLLLLENLRFSGQEEANSADYAGEIVDSVKPDFFVQDGFAVVHRAHASTDAITELVPSVAGLLLEKEINALSQVLDHPAKPFTLVLGGAKVEDKEPLITKFMNIADTICVGGKLAVDASGALASSLACRDIFPREDGRKMEQATEVSMRACMREEKRLAKATVQACMSGAEQATEASTQVYIASDFDEDSEGHKLDIGPLSTAKIVETVKNSKTVIWNGLLGKAEDPAFATSSTIVAKTLGESPEIYSVICGGDTSGFVEELQEEFPELKYSLVSTGGGAALEFLCGKSLPGYESLEDK